MAGLTGSGLETHPDGTGNLNGIVNNNWNELDNWINPAVGLTASQSTTTVTASAAIFTNDNIGDIIIFDSGEQGEITAVGSTTPQTTCTVDTSQTVASTSWKLMPASTDQGTALVRGLIKATDETDVLSDGDAIKWDDTNKKFISGGYLPNASLQTISVSGATTAIDVSSGNRIVVTLTQDTELQFSGMVQGARYAMLVVQDGTGGWFGSLQSSSARMEAGIFVHELDASSTTVFIGVAISSSVIEWRRTSEKSLLRLTSGINSRNVAGGMYFNGTSSQKIQSSLISGAYTDQGVSLESRFRIRALPSSLQGIVAVSPVNSNFQDPGGLGLMVTGTGVLQLRFYDADGGNFLEIESSSEVMASLVGQWVHVVGVKDTLNDEAHLYVNGVEVATSSDQGGTPPDWSDPVDPDYFLVGVGGSSSETFMGEINVSRFYNMALSASDVATIHRSGIPFDLQGSTPATTLTSGTLTIGRRYRIVSYVASDDFTNVGAASNATGVEFVATGTTPTTWTNSSQLRRIGAAVDLDLGIGSGTIIPDRSGNNYFGTSTSGVSHIQPKRLTVSRTASSSSTSLNLRDQQAQIVTIAANTTITATNAIQGVWYSFILTDNGSGPFTVNFDSATFEFEETDNNLSLAASATTVFYGIGRSNGKVRLFRDPNRAVSNLIAATNASLKSGGVYWNAGESGGGYVEIPNAPSKIGTQDFSIELIAKSKDWTDGANDHYFSLSPRTGGNRCLLYIPKTTGKPLIALYDAASTSNPYSFVTAPELPADKDVHIVVTCDRDGYASCYYDGIMVDRLSMSGSSSINLGDSNSNTIRLGSSGSHGFELAGSMKRYRIYNKALSLSEIGEIRRGEMPYGLASGNLTALTSGTLSIGRRYRITTYVAGDDFTNVGAASNATGVEFVATGTTPTTWSNSSSLIRVGAFLDIDLGNGNGMFFPDRSGNNWHGEGSGAIYNIVDKIDRIRDVAYSASITLNFNNYRGQTIELGSLTGNLTLATSNIKRGDELTLIFEDDGSSRTLTLPGWIAMDSALPAATTAGKKHVIMLKAHGTTDATILAFHSVEA